MADRMSAAHLAPQGGGYEPQRKANFEVELYGVPGQDLIKMSMKTADVPSIDNDVIDLNYMNQVIHVAGQAKWGDVSLVVRDFVDTQTLASLMAWKKLVTDPETLSTGFASAYKKQGAINMIAPDGSVERKFRLIGIWPKSVKPEGFDHTAGTSEHTVTVTLACDKAIPEF